MKRGFSFTLINVYMSLSTLFECWNKVAFSKLIYCYYNSTSIYNYQKICYQRRPNFNVFSKLPSMLKYHCQDGINSTFGFFVHRNNINVKSKWFTCWGVIQSFKVCSWITTFIALVEFLLQKQSSQGVL